jgi:hypothetical protein
MDCAHTPIAPKAMPGTPFLARHLPREVRPYCLRSRTGIIAPPGVPKSRHLRENVSESNTQTTMCRNIKTLFNFAPPVTDDEVRAASLQFVRKITGFNKPSKVNEESFQAAIEEIAAISTRLLHSLETTAPPKNREEEAAKAKARAAERYGT